MTVAFGVAGCRGWMQWPQFFNERLYTDYRAGEFVAIPRAYGFLWLFLAGIPWAGLGACGLAWCASGNRTTAVQWFVRLGCGIGTAWLLGVVLYDRFPQVFLPLYDALQDRYRDLDHNPSLWKLVRDNREAMVQMGLYLGFLGFEIARRDWKNAALILIVGLLNGVGWALLQNWMWAYRMWPGAGFNWWRAWESSGGISIGIAYGAAYYVVNRRAGGGESCGKVSADGQTAVSAGWLAAFLFSTSLAGGISLEVMPWWCAGSLTLVIAAFAVVYYSKARKGSGGSDAAVWSPCGPNLERWGAYTGLVIGLGLSVKNGLKGCLSLYTGDMPYWNGVFMGIAGPLMIAGVAAVSVWVLVRPRPAGPEDDPFPHAYGTTWLVLLVQYTLAVLISAPLTNWHEVSFAIYYLLLFCITAVIIFHCGTMKQKPGTP